MHPIWVSDQKRRVQCVINILTALSSKVVLRRLASFFDPVLWIVKYWRLLPRLSNLLTVVRIFKL